VVRSQAPHPERVAGLISGAGVKFRDFCGNVDSPQEFQRELLGFLKTLRGVVSVPT
jgi:hypothetical protein